MVNSNKKTRSVRTEVVACGGGIHTKASFGGEGLLRYLTLAVLGVVVACMGGVLQAQAPELAPIEIEYLWQSSPKLDVPWTPPMMESDYQIPLDRLNSPKASDRLYVAQLVTRLQGRASFHREETIVALMKRLEQGESHAQVRSALLGAACAIDDGSHAAELWNLSQGHAASRRLAEEYCIRCNSALPLPVWRSRVIDFSALDDDLIVACRGLTVVGNEQDGELLRSLVVDMHRPMSVRLAAASALGRLAKEAPLELVEQVKVRPGELLSQLQVQLLLPAKSQAAKERLRGIADEDRLTASRAAFLRLAEVDREWAKSSADRFVRHGDSEVRRTSYQLLAEIGTSDSRNLLLSGLGEAVPEIRNNVRHALLSTANRDDQARGQIADAIHDLLRSEDWRVVQQAVRLLVEFGDRKELPRLLELLDHPRDEVSITAAWAIRNTVKDPEECDLVLERCRDWTELIVTSVGSNGIAPEPLLRKQAHLLETLGLQRYEPAIPTLKKYVPKNNQTMGMITRIAGMTALGRCLEKVPSPELVKQLTERIADKDSMFSEPESIRFAATIALGFIADPSSRAALIKYDEPAGSPINRATTWALERLAP